MAPWLITVGKQKAVAGLSWVSLPGEKSPAEELKAEAKRAGSRFAALYPNESGRYKAAALVPANLGRTMDGAVPVSAWLAEIVDVPTIYLEAVDDSATLWWIVQVKPGGVEIRTDIVVSDDEAIRMLDDAIGAAYQDGVQLKLIIGRRNLAPQSAMIDRADKVFENITDVLARGPAPSYKIKQVIGVPRVVWIALSLVVVLAMAAAGLFYLVRYTTALQTESARRAAEEARAAEQARLKKIAEERSIAAVIEAIRVDTATPAVPVLIKHCSDVAASTPRVLGGWQLVSLTCDPVATTVTANYQRNPAARGGLSTQMTLEHAVAGVGATLAPLQAMSDQAAVTFAKREVATREGLETTELPVYSDISGELTTAVQTIQSTLPTVTAQFSAPAARPVLYADPKLDATAPATIPVLPALGYSKGSITFTGTDLWRLEASAIDRPYLSAGPVTFNVSGSTFQWSIQLAYFTKG